MSIARTRQSRQQFAIKVLSDSGTPTLPNAAGDTVTVELTGVPARGLIRRVAIVAKSENVVLNQPRFYDGVYLHLLGTAGKDTKTLAFAESIFGHLAYDLQNRNSLTAYSMSDTPSGAGARFVSVVDCTPVCAGGAGTGAFYLGSQLATTRVSGSDLPAGTNPHLRANPALDTTGSPASEVGVQLNPVEGSTIVTTSGTFPPGGIFYDTQSTQLAGVAQTVEGPNFTEGNKLYVTLQSEGFAYNTNFHSLTFIIDIEPTH
tara:strand:- start:538 stop:1317 length:780 start_codon:yes stop_codon:yes gene_type:complete